MSPKYRIEGRNREIVELVHKNPLITVMTVAKKLGGKDLNVVNSVRSNIKTLIKSGWLIGEQTMNCNKIALGLRATDKAIDFLKAEAAEKQKAATWEAKKTRNADKIVNLDVEADKNLLIKAETPVQRALRQAVEDNINGYISDDVRFANDPIAWIKECKPKIESKDYGLIVYEPWPVHEDIIRRVANNERVIIDKSRQTGITTAIMVALAHQLLYAKPCHAHIVANKEDVAVKSMLRKAKRALETAELSELQRSRLRLGGAGTTTIYYQSPAAENYIMAHAASPDAGHSFDGNKIFLDEYSRMPYAEEIYIGLSAMLNNPDFLFMISSTYNGDGDFFCRLIDEADNGENGFTHIPIDWRVHPDRDDKWRETEIARFRSVGKEYEFMEQHELYRISTGEQAFDISQIEKNAKNYSYIGKDPIDGHRYSKGIDQSSTTGGDKTVACVIDTTVIPAQVVYMEEFRVRAMTERTATQQKKDFIERIDAIYPGPLFIDGTNERAIASEVDVRDKTGIAITAGMSESKKYDALERMKWRRIPRDNLVSYCVGTLEMGRLIVHLHKFPDLYEALKSARKGVAKRRGKKVDHMDALLLANLPLSAKSNKEKTEIHEIKNTSKMRNIRGRKF